MNNTDNNQIVEDKHSKIEEIKEAMKKTDSKRIYSDTMLYSCTLKAS